MTIRCPRCQKKHDEPCPKRCGCGQSLLGALAAGRRSTDGHRPLPALAAARQRGNGIPTESGENEW
jgi:hypothetical protein